MKRRLTRTAKRQRDDLMGTIILIVVALVIVGLGAVYFRAKSMQVTLDAQTLCPADGPEGLTIVLVDRTDVLTTVQREDLRQRLMHIKDTLPKDTAIEVYSVGSVEGDLIRPEGKRLCNAGRKQDVDAMFGNPRLTEKRWQERFSAPLDKLFEKLVSSGTSERSPIMESIQSISVGAFGTLSPRAKHRKLVIASDMLQNTEALSQYKELAPFTDFRQTDPYRRLRTDLRGVEVEILYFGRRSDLQGRKHIEFWQDYFADSGATLVHVTNIQG